MKRRLHDNLTHTKRLIRTILSRISHLWKRRRNRVLAVLFLVNLILLFLLYSNTLSYPNTMIGTTRVSGKSAKQIETLLQKQEEMLPRIQVKDRTYQYRYDQLGIVIDRRKAVHDVFSPNKTLFPLNLFLFIRSLFVPRHIGPPLAFTQDFDQFIADATFHFGEAPNDISVDPATKSLLLAENSQTYRFDKEGLKHLLLARFGNDAYPLYPQLSKVTNQTIDQITDVNQKLSRIFSAPIMMYLDMGGTSQTIELKEEDIREATIVTVVSDEPRVTITVNAQALNRVLAKRIRAAGFPIRESIVTQNVQGDFLKAVHLRYTGMDIAAVSTTLDDGPNTDGSIAGRYIEVDISQQNMYLFKDGAIYKTYRVSTGLDYPTPIGKFTILNKVDLGFSTIYSVWLPWWMGFKYSDELGAYFGIHEQPYILTAEGKPVIRDPRIGTPSTGGCIALPPGAAQEVYWFTFIGTPIYIFE